MRLRISTTTGMNRPSRLAQTVWRSWWYKFGISITRLAFRTDFDLLWCVMKHSAEYRRFTNLVDRLLTVSHEEMQRREAEYRKEVDANPHRRGPKRGAKKKRKAATP